MQLVSAIFMDCNILFFNRSLLLMIVHWW